MLYDIVQVFTYYSQHMFQKTLKIVAILPIVALVMAVSLPVAVFAQTDPTGNSPDDQVVTDSSESSQTSTESTSNNSSQVQDFATGAGVGAVVGLVVGGGLVWFIRRRE